MVGQVSIRQAGAERLLSSAPCFLPFLTHLSDYSTSINTDLSNPFNFQNILKKDLINSFRIILDLQKSCETIRVPTHSAPRFPCGLASRWSICHNGTKIDTILLAKGHALFGCPQPFSFSVPGSHVTFSCPVSSGSSWPGQFLRLLDNFEES